MAAFLDYDQPSPERAQQTVNGVSSMAEPTFGCRSAAKLLVSVRNATEALAALHGGCDVLDIKEPARGALGMADVATIAQVVAILQTCGRGSFEEATVPDGGDVDLNWKQEPPPLTQDGRLPVSVALGEAFEWTSDRSIPRLPAGISFIKLGTAGLESGADWARSFGAVKNRISASIHSSLAQPSEPTAGITGGFAPSWIAVACADWQIARGPAPRDVIAAAPGLGCTGVLIDTFSKGRLRLLDWLNGRQLSELAAHARSLDLTFSLAGRLQVGDLATVLAASPDIVGIRSAACRDGIRESEIAAAAVHAFREALLIQGASSLLGL